MGSFALTRGNMMAYRSLLGGGGGGQGGGGGGGISTPTPSPTPSGGAAAGDAGGFSDIYQQALERLSTGGLSLEADLAGIEAGKREAIGRGEQNIVSAGLAGTTIMGSAPLAAEKGAALSRLKARGTAEEKYLTALTNFANLAFQAEEGRLGRESSMQRLQTQIGAQERASAADRAFTGSASFVPAHERTSDPYPLSSGYTTPRKMTSMGPTTDWDAISGGNYSDQFPSLYGSGGQLPEVPSLY